MARAPAEFYWASRESRENAMTNGATVRARWMSDRKTNLNAMEALRGLVSRHVTARTYLPTRSDGDQSSLQMS